MKSNCSPQNSMSFFCFVDVRAYNVLSRHNSQKYLEKRNDILIGSSFLLEFCEMKQAKQITWLSGQFVDVTPKWNPSPSSIIPHVQPLPPSPPPPLGVCPGPSHPLTSHLNTSPRRNSRPRPPHTQKPSMPWRRPGAISVAVQPTVEIVYVVPGAEYFPLFSSSCLCYMYCAGERFHPTRPSRPMWPVSQPSA